MPLATSMRPMPIESHGEGVHPLHANDGSERSHRIAQHGKKHPNWGEGRREALATMGAEAAPPTLA